MLDITYTAALEITSGFTLGTDKLNTGVLGYLQTPLTAPIRSASWRRGRDSMLDDFSAGSCTVVFDNRDRLLDPANTASPFYGELYPGRGFSLTMVQGTASAQVFSGYVDSWTYDYTIDGDAIVTVTVLDAFSYLANQIVTNVVAPAELSGARVQRVLASIGWPLSRQSVDVGYSTLAAETITGVSALEYLSKVAQSEFGMFFADAQGVLKFRQRNRVNTFSDIVLSNALPAGLNYVESIDFDYSFDRVFNSVVLTNQNLALSASSSSTVSVNKYGKRSSEFDTLISSSTQMQSIADGLVTLYGTPDFIARTATINLENVDLLVTGDINVNVNQSTVDIGLLTSLYWVPPGSTGTDPIYKPALMITGVKYDTAPGSYHVTLNLDYALGYDAMILDDPTNGRLDYGKLGV